MPPIIAGVVDFDTDVTGLGKKKWWCPAPQFSREVVKVEGSADTGLIAEWSKTVCAIGTRRRSWKKSAKLQGALEASADSQAA